MVPAAAAVAVSVFVVMDAGALVEGCVGYSDGAASCASATSPASIKDCWFVKLGSYFIEWDCGRHEVVTGCCYRCR